MGQLETFDDVNGALQHTKTAYSGSRRRLKKGFTQYPDERSTVDFRG